jgi:hypothetical protein
MVWYQNGSSNGWLMCRLVYIPDQTELFSRAKGLLETGVLQNRNVGIIGLGSGGSPVALELARSGQLPLPVVPLQCEQQSSLIAWKLMMMMMKST